jgi:hypothetical protein
VEKRDILDKRVKKEFLNGLNLSENMAGIFEQVDHPRIKSLPFTGNELNRFKHSILH